MGRRSFFIALLIVCSASRVVFSQDASADSVITDIPASAPETAGEEDYFLKTLPLDISTSGYYDLVEWLKRLGLEGSGKIQDLRARLYQHYGVSAPAEIKKTGRRIRIENAQTSEYFTLDEIDEDYIRLSGRVVIIISDDEKGETHRIEADTVVLNQSTNSMSAAGNILYSLKAPDKNEYYFGERLTINMDDWRGLLLDGVLQRGERSGAGSEKNVLNFEADTIIKDEGGVLVFDNGLITSCDAEYPHYSIRAGRVWILGGDEWAIANAVLSIGEIPVLYIPFFYYPSEEIVFHPVFGYREREGRLLQTTTYFLGEKPPKDDKISFFRMLKTGESLAKNLQGVFLRTGTEKKKQAGSNILKLMADVYSNLGASLSVRGKLGNLGFLDNVDFYAGIGVSRSIFYLNDGTYSPFSQYSDYQSVWNESSIPGASVPLRFSLELTTTLSLWNQKINLKLPVATDPFFNIDFGDRSEDMNWLRFLEQEETETLPSRISALRQSIDTSLSFPVSFLNPWLTSLDIRRLSSSLSWNLKSSSPIPVDTAELALFSVDPGREFFFPESLVIADAELSARGTIFSLPLKTSGTPATGSTGQTAMASGGTDTSKLALEVPWNEPEKNDSSETAATAEIPEEHSSDSTGFPPPEAAGSIKLPELPPVTASLSYSLAPSSGYERRFMTSTWNTPSSIDWDILYDVLNYRVSADLQGSLAWSSYANMSMGIAYQNTGQARPYRNVNATALELDEWNLLDAKARSENLNGSLSLSISPFADEWFWAKTTFSYGLTSRLYSLSYGYMDADTPVYSTNFLEFTKESISRHSLMATLAIQPYGYEQSLALSSTLPPLLESYGLNLKLSAPVINTLTSTTYSRKPAGGTFSWDYLNNNTVLKIDEVFSLNNIFIYDLENGQALSDNCSLVAGPFSAGFTMIKTRLYRLESGTGWTQNSGSADTFRPSSISMNLKIDGKLEPFWKNRITTSLLVNTAVSQSLLRFTESSMTVNAEFKFSVFEAFDFTFKSTSQNSNLWRYFPGLYDLSNIPLLKDLQPINPVDDILKSFDFFTDGGSNRYKSFWKLKNLSLGIARRLHDWDLSLDLIAAPIIDTSGSQKRYIIDASVSILIAWRALSEFKVDVKTTKTGTTIN